MNKPEGFDDLVRRKLEERAFSFEEAHWLEVQRAILAAQRRKRPSGWWLAAPAALLIGLGGWWVVDGADATVASLPEGSAPAVGNRGVPVPQTQEQVQEANAPVAPAPTLAPEPPEQEAAVTDQAKEKPLTKPAARVHENAPAVQKKGSTAASADPQELEKLGAKPEATVAAIGVAAKSDTSEPIGSSDPPTAKDHGTDEPARNVALSATVVADPGVSGSGDAPPASKNDGADGVASGVVMSTAVVADPGTNAAEVPTEPATTTVGEPANEIAEERIAQEAVADSTVPSVVASADSAVVATVPPAPLVDAASPWEISGMLGIMLTSNRYTGGGSEAWGDAISGEPTPTYGAEFMHMGRNFGIGTGLHYSTYAESMQAEERSSTLIDIEKYWYLQPTSLDVLVITDTIDSLGMTYYVGETQNQIVNVLAEGADTTVTTTVQRSGREQVNRTSYLEIPLLLDAHMTQGRWMFGLRGGPMLGVLTGRRGAVPNAADDGYDEFEDQAFRSLIVGYMARAYIRYRFNSAWSIGLEPTIKGHLMDTYSAGELSRKTAGYGGVLSVTYRLR